jgi:hypothetical protein
VQSKVKVLLTVFFDYRGIVHHSYAPEGQTINKEYYLEVIFVMQFGARDRTCGLMYSETSLNGHPPCADTSLLLTIF